MSGRLTPYSYDMKEKEISNDFNYEKDKNSCEHGPMTIQTDAERRTMLAKLHEECDSFGTGVVRTTKLVEKLRLLVQDNTAVDKELLNELSRLLDPKDDDGHVKKDEFVSIGMDWISILDQKSQNSKSISGNVSVASLGLLDSAIIKDLQFETTFEGNMNTTYQNQYMASNISCKNIYEREYSDDSDSMGKHKKKKGRLINSENGDKTFELNGNARLEIHQQEKVNNLMSLNKRMSLEANTLKKQLVSAESEAAHVQSENDLLKMQLIEGKKASRMKSSPLMENNSSGNSQNGRRHSTDGLFGNHSMKNLTFTVDGPSTVESLNSDFDVEYSERHELLEDRNRKINKELIKHKKLLKEFKLQEGKSLEIVDKLENELNMKKYEIVRLKQRLTRNPEIENEKVEESRLMTNRLEEEIQKLKADLTTALDEISQMSHQNQDSWRDVFGEQGRILTFSASEISFDQLHDTDQLEGEFKDILTVRRSVSAPIKPFASFSQYKGPKSSTPFCPGTPVTKPLRGSIGDEMKKLGVNGSPLLDKRIEVLNPRSNLVESTVSKEVEVEQLESKTMSINETKSTIPYRQNVISKIEIQTIDISTQTDDQDKEVSTTEEHPEPSQILKKLPRSMKDLKIYVISVVSYFRKVLCKKFVEKPLPFRLLISCFIMLILFTFFGAYEVDDRKYYPITWPKGLADWLNEQFNIKLPEPIAIISKKHIYPPNVY